MPSLKYFLLLPIIAISLASLPSKKLLAQEPVAHTEKRHFKKINQKAGRGKKGKRFILIQEAATGVLEDDPKHPGRYLLVLNGVSPHLQFYKSQPNRSFGIIYMRQYVWFCKIGRNAFLKCKRGALGYVSFSSSTKPEVLELFHSKYLKKENKLIYEVAPVDSFSLKAIEMKDVTLIIDIALN